MVELGYQTTQPVSLDDMLHHCRAVSRGAKVRCFIDANLILNLLSIHYWLVICPLGHMRSLKSKLLLTHIDSLRKYVDNYLFV